jgi:hypothetical protein
MSDVVPGEWMPDYRTIYRTNDGHLRVPFTSLGSFLRVEESRVSVAEARAIENVATFVFSAGIMSRRLKEYIDAYREETWVEVPIRDLFLDTQSFFLFVQQFLEDLALIVRMSLPHKQRHQMPAAFSHLMPRLLKDVLAPDAPLAQFWLDERTWFDEIKSLRDDILHRTAFGRNRAAIFPDSFDVIRAGGGQPHFISGADLQTYVGNVLVRIFALACLSDEFVRTMIINRHPNAKMPLQDGILLAPGESDLSANDLVERFGLGTFLVTMSAKSQSALEYFMAAGEAPVTESS